MVVLKHGLAAACWACRSVWRVIYCFDIIQKASIFRLYYILGMYCIINKHPSQELDFRHKKRIPFSKKKGFLFLDRRDERIPAHNHPLSSWLPLCTQLARPIIIGLWYIPIDHIPRVPYSAVQMRWLCLWYKPWLLPVDDETSARRMNLPSLLDNFDLQGFNF